MKSKKRNLTGYSTESPSNLVKMRSNSNAIDDSDLQDDTDISSINVFQMKEGRGMSQDYYNDIDFFIHYKQIFKGNDGCYALFFEPNSNDQNKKSKKYISKNEALTDAVRLKHMKGEHRVAVYPMLQNDTCYFIAGDFDNHDGVSNPSWDSFNFYKMAESYDIPSYIMRSMSGNGYHVYIFFESPVPAVKARLVSNFIVDQAGIQRGNEHSLDKFFPSQDKLSGKKLGNAIALPFHGRSVEDGNTVFLHPISRNSMPPYSDQFEILKNIEKVSESILDKIIAENSLESKSCSNHTVPDVPDINELMQKCLKCRAMEFAYQHPNNVSYPLWYALLSNLVSIRPHGMDLCHEISKNYDAYTNQETREKAVEALNRSRPQTCKTIRGYYDCGKDCGVTSPIHIIDGYSNAITKKSVAISNLQEIKAKLKLFCSEDKIGCAVTNNNEIYEIATVDFGYFLRKQYEQNYGGTLDKKIRENFINDLNEEASFDGDKITLYHRVAQIDDAIYIDLGRADRKTVKIHPDLPNGWEIIANAPVYFKRHDNMKELPLPVSNGNINDFRKLINCPNDDAWQLIMGWALGAVNSSISYPPLIINGEQGSAKSTLTSLIQNIVDPSNASLRSFCSNKEDFYVAAYNAWVLCFDNLSKLTQENSNDICRMSTGGTFSTRRYYTHKEEVVFTLKRPLILNGINNMVQKADLLDRAIVIDLPPIKYGTRKTDKEIKAEFDRILPGVLGEFYSAVAEAMRNFDSVNLTDPDVRMLDFAVWVTAAESRMGWESGDFYNAYKRNRKNNEGANIGSNPLALAIVDLMKNESSWEGHCKELHNEIEALPSITLEMKKTTEWPNGANVLSRRLRELAPQIRSIYHIDITFKSKNTGSVITLTKI